MQYAFVIHSLNRSTKQLKALDPASSHVYRMQHLGYAKSSVILQQRKSDLKTSTIHGWLLQTDAPHVSQNH